ncbi:MAG: endonuclease/exonuclease/phosphatase family protein [Bacteroidales bacterium]|nr:endonuclease/exonuclease/phosphatase family protein [Bacteroidales bacterium]
MKTLLKVIFWVVVAVIVGLSSLIIYASLSDYKPGKEEIVFELDSIDVYPNWPEIDIITWNIGYCGLSADMDFFYDGGKKVRPAEDQVKKNLKEIIEELQASDTLEFILLQEVDKNSKRSYGICEYDSIRNALPNYKSFFGKNYDVFFVPLPPTEPMGRVESGLQTLSKSWPSSSVRFSFPGQYAWPKSLFMLDRCFLVNRYPMNSGKELVVINTHNSAYDTGGVLRTQQMNYLKGFLSNEYEKGNYVIVGGDWNQSPPSFKPEYTDNVFDNQDLTLIPDGFLPDNWKWVYDGTQPTNRRVMMPFEKGKTPTTVIDFYLLSPNIEAISVKTSDLGFRNSDHQPVRLKLRLLQ